MVKLGECIKLVSGKFLPVKHRIDGEYNVYGGNGITGIHNEYFIDYQTVVIGRVGEYCGCVHMTDEKVWITDNALYVNKFLRDIHRKYLCYVLNSKKLNHYANKSGQPSISQSAILKIQIPLPPLDVQKKIAQTLDVAAELIALRKKQLAELDNLIKATFYDMFGDPVVNEKMWSLEEMGNLGECNSGGTPTRSNPSYFLGDIDWYSAGELNQRYLIQSKERLTIDAIKNSAAKIFKKRSMLIGMYDTAAFKLGILTKDSASNQACANISVNADLVNIVWLYDCAQIMRPFFLTSRRGIRQKNLNLGMIKRFKIPLPPISLQNEFAEIVTKIEEQKSLVQKAIDESQYLFDSLMSEYFE
ncbi:MAG: restriction modification system specificity domain protein [Firmicutes bacterium]|nr:restriction modification system specificity domain protein [Bacillota bacterium]